MRHALVSAEGQILEYRDLPDGPNVDQLALAPGKPRLLPVEAVIPTYDADSERLVRQPDEILEDKVIESFAVESRDLDERKQQMRAQVNAMRDQRLRQPFPFMGKRFDYDDDSQKRITGAGALAHIAITVGGKSPTDEHWHGGEDPFRWIDADNGLVTMDAQTVLAFGQAAGQWDSAHVFAAKGMKLAIAAAPDHATLDAIDLEAGWPE